MEEERWGDGMVLEEALKEKAHRVSFLLEDVVEEPPGGEGHEAPP